MASALKLGTTVAGYYILSTPFVLLTDDAPTYPTPHVWVLVHGRTMLVRAADLISNRSTT